MNKFYYHGLSGVVRSNFWSIIKGGELKSKRKRRCGVAYGFNGFDFISVCKKYSDEAYSNPKNAFYRYIVGHVCFVISDKVVAVKPELLEGYTDSELNHITYQDQSKRYTDLFDEYQIKDEIPLDKIVAVGMPLSNLDFSDSVFGMREEEYYDFVREVELFAEAYNIPLLDSNNPKFADEFEELFQDKKELCYNTTRSW